ncbi:hypothetical protein QCN29_25570 [Streptomyces sp. HNM0663]|uniref:WXG100 family type VII secretion target n=1 Tax=Streptomyces chengmaiensis TaxID=3040919 RepID=A0ABT6HTQ5_9ACTN|nr:hypothetical protein [Streptomyces chengmaiensis]MDH2392091.1 hypothetical protein [Streptomyces chengmaiensis]
MALSYTDLRNVNLEKLSAAVGAWAGLPGLVHQAGWTFNNVVAKGLRESDWEGETAEAAFTTLRGIKNQIDNAEHEADSVHRFLNNCLESFRSAKRVLDDIAAELAGHTHLSLNTGDGSVFVDSAKVEPNELAKLQEAYTSIIKGYKERTEQALEDARKTDETLRWSLQDMSDKYHIGFLPTAPVSLADARRMRKERAQEDSGKKISLKELSDKEIQTKLDNASKGKFGESWLKPAAEFIGYRAWLNSANSAQKGKWADAESYFIAGTPAYAAGMEASLMESSGGGGRHRKPTLMNKAGWLGGKVFGFPAGVVATGLDFYYTPAQSASQGPDAKIMAPKDPGRVHWK